MEKIISAKEARAANKKTQRKIKKVVKRILKRIPAIIDERIKAGSQSFQVSLKPKSIPEDDAIVAAKKIGSCMEEKGYKVSINGLSVQVSWGDEDTSSPNEMFICKMIEESLSMLDKQAAIQNLMNDIHSMKTEDDVFLVLHKMSELGIYPPGH